jgi:hypothetical protein
MPRSAAPRRVPHGPQRVAVRDAPEEPEARPTSSSLAPAHRRLGSLLETLAPARNGAYLLTALRVCGDIDASLASSITRDVAALVKQGEVSGRAFLRVAGADLDQ